MSFSHIALAVSDIPSAASFYAAALQPLGYRYIGREGHALGFGVDSADFFLTPAPRRTRISPSHVAFHAESRAVVRQCYSAALRAQGIPSGVPSHRHDGCECYNAAVEDFDGHRIEFIFREPHVHEEPDESNRDDEPASTRVRDWQDNVADSPTQDAASVASRSRSRIDSALGLASQASKAMSRSGADKTAEAVPSSESSARSISGSGITSKGLLGLGVAAAAGAAIVYSIVTTERRNAREEAKFEASVSTQRTPYNERAIEMTPPTPPTNIQPQFSGRHRSSSSTESRFSTRRARMLALEEHPFEDVDGYDSRAGPVVRTTHDFVYLPARQSRDDDGLRPISRSATEPIEAYSTRQLIEAPKSTSSRRHSHHGVRSSHSSSSRHSSRHHRRRSHDDRASSRHDSGISIHSRSHSTSKRIETIPEAGENKSSTSTVNPSHRDLLRQAPTSRSGSVHVEDSLSYPAGIPLPPSVSGYSRAPSTARPSARSTSHYESAVELPASDSRAGRSSFSASRAAKIPLPESHAGAQDPNWEDIPGRPDDEDDNITLAEVDPSDSISCVDFSSLRHNRPRAHRHHSSDGGRRSSAEPPRRRHQSSSSRNDDRDRTPRISARTRSGSNGGGSRHSAMTLPVRMRTNIFTDDLRTSARRSVHTYA